MAEIPDDIIQALRSALNDLAETGATVTHPVREHLGVHASMALDDLLAASYQLVEAAAQPAG